MQDLPGWLQPFTQGLVEGESGSSGSAGGKIWRKTPGFNGSSLNSAKVICRRCLKRRGAAGEETTRVNSNMKHPTQQPIVSTQDMQCTSLPHLCWCFVLETQSFNGSPDVTFHTTFFRMKHSIPRTPPPHSRTNVEGSKVLNHFPKDPRCEKCRLTKSRELHSEGILKVEKTGYHKLQNWGRGTITADHKVLNEENESQHRYAGGGTRFGHSVDTESSVQKQDCTRDDEKFAAILTSKKEAWSDLQ